MKRDVLEIAPRVRNALEAGVPVVALESTIIAHGMPYPINAGTALKVERVVEEAGAAPATVGVIGGRITVGLTREQINFLATSKDVWKAGERDLPVVVARRQNAATTAGASLAIAAAAGIRVLVTGGIGGVGPMATLDFDISADLLAIAQYPVITVCSGTKAFMNIAGTLEYLETFRVPVATYRSDEFPMFYSRGSGLKTGWRVDIPAEVADAYRAMREIGAYGGMLVGVPPPEEHALSEEETRRAIESALRKLSETGITGKAITPFLLDTIQQETGGRSLTANIALIQNNAQVGAEIAVALRG